MSTVLIEKYISGGGSLRLTWMKCR